MPLRARPWKGAPGSGVDCAAHADAAIGGISASIRRATTWPGRASPAARASSRTMLLIITSMRNSPSLRRNSIAAVWGASISGSNSWPGIFQRIQLPENAIEMIARGFCKVKWTPRTAAGPRQSPGKQDAVCRRIPDRLEGSKKTGRGWTRIRQDGHARAHPACLSRQIPRSLLEEEIRLPSAFIRVTLRFGFLDPANK